MKTKTIRILQGLGIVLLVVVLGVLALRPFYLNWGATAEDRGRAMPGDLSGTRWTRAMVIGATPDTDLALAGPVRAGARRLVQL